MLVDTNYTTIRLSHLFHCVTSSIVVGPDLPSEVNDHQTTWRKEIYLTIIKGISQALDGPTNGSYDTENSSQQGTMRKPLNCLDEASRTGASMKRKSSMKVKVQDGSREITLEYQVACSAHSRQHKLVRRAEGERGSHIQAKRQVPPAKEEINICDKWTDRQKRENVMQAHVQKYSDCSWE